MEGNISSELRSYRSAQKRYAKRKFNYSNLDELIKNISQSQVVYLGDFHTFDQSSRNLKRLILHLLEEKQTFSLGVELIHTKHQQFIDAFLDHHITEKEFLEMVEYDESWKFPWKYYAPFFETAKKNRLRVLALNSYGNLSERDSHAASIISDHLKKNPDERLLILFGELHLLPNKLPQKVKKPMKSFPRFRQTIIHQNIDDVFWSKHYENEGSIEQIIKFNEDEFSLQTSPPWIKYESMIHWYESVYDDPEFFIHDYVIDQSFF